MDNEQLGAGSLTKFAQVAQEQTRHMAVAPCSVKARHGVWFTISGLALGVVIALLAGQGVFLGAACGAMLGSYTSWFVVWLRKNSHAA